MTQSERERILQRLGRIYCVEPNTQKQLDADLLETVADIIIDESNKSYKRGSREAAQPLIEFTDKWIIDCQKYPSQIAGVQQKIFDMYADKLRKIISENQPEKEIGK